ncbi:MAG: DEAD/DEAH box helicase [Bacteroidales bacterium]|nr:DEAD/DEAH box helicase [Bacteroidales bacterium]
MEKQFIIVLKQHRIFGWIAKPYWVKKANKDFFEIIESISAMHADKNINEFPEIQQKLIKITDLYSEQEITKLFSKKKKASRDFINNIKDDAIVENIRKYIEKKLVKIFELIRISNIPLYQNAESKNVYYEDRIEPQKGYAETVFNFEKTPENSKYYLSIKDGENELKLFNKHGHIITNSPCTLLLENKLYFFKPEPEGVDGKKLVPFFTKEFVNIPKSSEKKYFETFVHKSIEKYNVKAKGFDIKTPEIIPKSVLIFEKDWKNQFNMILKFDYRGNLISPQYPKNKFVKAHLSTNDYQYEVLLRNYDFEQKKIEFLHSIGLNDTGNHNYKIKNLEDGEHNETEMIEWLNKYGSILEENDFEIQQKFFNKKYFIEKAWIDFQVDDKNDWFDIQATVNFGNFNIPFKKLRNHIKNEIKEFKLPNGEIAIIPEEWFAKYKDFMLFSKDSGNNLKLDKHHFQVLTQDIEEIDQNLLKKINKIAHKEFELPKSLQATLRPYQKTGYNWISSLFENNLGVCLADDMGLGKTLQTLAAIRRILDTKATESKKTATKQLSLFDTNPEKGTINKNSNRAGLIVMPTSLIHNWLNEINKFAPDIKAHIYSGWRREKNTKIFDNYDLILTSYGLVRNDIDILSEYQYRFVVLDESQTIKNPQSKTYQAIMKLQADYRMVLTGTPIENSLTDLWAQMNFINKGLLGSFNFFKEEYVEPIEKKQDAILRENLENRLQKIIQPFFLRRSKEEVAKDLPDLTETVHYCTMHENQYSLYEKEKSKIRNVLLNSIDAKKSKTEKNMLVIQALTRLRLIANHSKLIDEHKDYPSGKFEEVTRMLESLISENHKVLIFSSFVKHLQLYVDYFKQNGWKYSMLTGKTQNREQVINEFSNDKENKLFLISLKAGGAGLNLTAADYVFLLDPWWNPAVEKQAIARAHRIGQTNKVMAYRFISENSIEEKIIKYQKKKQKLADVFINDNNPFGKLSEKDILELFD